MMLFLGSGGIGGRNVHRTSAQGLPSVPRPKAIYEGKMKEFGGGEWCPGARMGALLRKACSCLRQGTIIDPLQCDFAIWRGLRFSETLQCAAVAK